MLRNRGVAIGVAGWVMLLHAGTAHAGLITSPAEIVGPVDVIDFSDRPTQTTTLGPESVGHSVGRDVVFTATNVFGVAGFSAALYGLGENGVWNSDRTYVFTNPNPGSAETSTIRFQFEDGLVSSVGAFLNYCIAGPGAGCDAPRLRVYDSSLQILEEYDLSLAAPISTPNGVNEGAFRGITRASADIFAFEFVGAGVLDDLTFSQLEQVPEPPAWVLLWLGLALLILPRTRVPTWSR